MSGKDIEYPIVNALRKVCMNQIPIYAFHPSKINILRNNSVFDNSYMRERLSQLPILKLNHNIKFLASKSYKDVNFADPKLVKHVEDTNEIELYIKIKNHIISYAIAVYHVVFIMIDCPLFLNNL